MDFLKKKPWMTSKVEKPRFWIKRFLRPLWAKMCAFNATLKVSHLKTTQGKIWIFEEKCKKDQGNNLDFFKKIWKDNIQRKIFNGVSEQKLGENVDY